MLSINAGNAWAKLSYVERNEYSEIEEGSKGSRRTSTERENGL